MLRSITLPFRYLVGNITFFGIFAVFDLSLVDKLLFFYIYVLLGYVYR